MSFLLINLMVLALLAAAGVFAHSQLQSCEADEWKAAAPSIDYGALQAHWRGVAAARDWETLQAQVRRWQEAGGSGAGSPQCEEIARHLNQAVFRFAVPGQPLALGRSAGDGVTADGRAGAAHCPARLRARARS